MMRSSHRRESSEGKSILTTSSMPSLTAGEISSCGQGNFPAATHRCPPPPTREGAAIGLHHASLPHCIFDHVLAVLERRPEKKKS